MKIAGMTSFSVSTRGAPSAPGSGGPTVTGDRSAEEVTAEQGVGKGSRVTGRILRGHR